MILELNKAEVAYRAAIAKAIPRTVTIPAITDEEGNVTQPEETIEIPAALPVIPDEYTVKALIARFNQSSAQLAIRTGQTRHTAFTTYGGEPSPYDSDSQSAANRKRTNSRVDRDNNKPNNNKSKKKKQFASSGDSVREGGWRSNKQKEENVKQWTNTDKRREIIDSIRTKVREQSTASHPSLPTNQLSDTLDAGDQASDTETRHRALVTTSYTAFNTQKRKDPPFSMLHSWTLDCASDVHVCNNPMEFEWERPAYDEFIGSGDSVSPVLAYGKCHVTLSTPSGPWKFTLLNIALVPNYVTSLVALSRLSGGDVHFNSGRLVLYRLNHQDNPVWCNVFKNGGHFVLIGRKEEFTEPSGTIRNHSD
ncbi:hypothetical protein CC80DRAFT_549701 [Byssothecium circinans]|uniref:Uncharacterized protein n=1 Tax=Byssothecium circinans TaxID=147558 RepID=A0A6A5TSL5_9PLEO|nr:hypothetical protein CC80DRAFT_549701 [Byssothecium circinans]